MQSQSELVLTDEPDAVPMARRFTAAAVAGQPVDLRDDAELLVAELVTNALLHGQGPITLRLDHRELGVRIEVEDRGNNLPVPARWSSDAMTGRGLSLVAALARTWGVDRLPDGGKVVWAELSDITDRSAAEMSDLEIDELLKAWDDDFDADDVRFTVRLGAVPTDLLLEAKAHIDNVVRELMLVKADEAASGVQLPAPMAALVHTVTTDFAEARAEIKRQAMAAAARGAEQTDLVLSLPLSAADAGERYLAALDEADNYARDVRMLTVAAPRSHRVFRRWYVQSLVDQLRAVAIGATPPEPRPLQVVLPEVETRVHWGY